MKTNYGEVDERQDGFFCMRILWRVDFACEERPWALLVCSFLEMAHVRTRSFLYAIINTAPLVTDTKWGEQWTHSEVNKRERESRNKNTKEKSSIFA